MIPFEAISSQYPLPETMGSLLKPVRTLKYRHPLILAQICITILEFCGLRRRIPSYHVSPMSSTAEICVAEFMREMWLTCFRYKISSADIAFRCDATVDDLIDVIEEKSRRYIPVIYALNKIDAISIEELDLLYR